MKYLSLCFISVFFMMANYCSAKSTVPQTVKPDVHSEIDKKNKMVYLNIDFPAKYKKDLKYNFEGPWKLKSTGDINYNGKGNLNLKVDRKKKAMPMFNESKGRFEIPFTASKKFDSTMTVTYFYCTKEEGGWCRRVVEEGKAGSKFKQKK